MSGSGAFWTASDEDKRDGDSEDIAGQIRAGGGTLRQARFGPVAMTVTGVRMEKPSRSYRAMAPVLSA